MRMRQLFLVGYYFRSNMVAKHVVVTLTFRLKVEDALDSFEEVQTKIKQIEEPCSFTNNQGTHIS